MRVSLPPSRMASHRSDFASASSATRLRRRRLSLWINSPHGECRASSRFRSTGTKAHQAEPGPRFAEAFRKAGEAGLKRTVHAGESSGPEGVRDAIELLGADRIDHGVRAIEDPAVVALLAERGIPLGVCPTSNIALRVYSSMDEHPVDRLRRGGVRVSINTDDPSLLMTNLPHEYEIAMASYAWSEDVLREVARVSIEASFARPDTKEKLRSKLTNWRIGSETFDEISR
jgi:adenosine deaminase